ncbi:MAG: DNA primase [Flammeovirgaceae bacterium]|nr:DNA primase [Flammeovirgaceae bacterium]
MRISDDTIRQIHDASDIVEVVEEFVPLKKKGQNWWALSPFIDEKTPSFTVSPSKGIYKCFSSGKGGDAISFVMEMEGIGYIEALKFLAKKYGIEVEEEELTPAQQETQSFKESLLIALNHAKKFYQDNLKVGEGKAIGASYFKERGFDWEVIEKFELGFALNQWNAFEENAVKNGFKAEILEKSGLVIKKEEGKSYDRFRGRVIFPIHNVSGRAIGFGARTLKKDEKPKYINSPESEVYHKSQILYGMFQAKKAIRDKENCYLVEGYTDVISLHQEGIENVVASSGTSLTEEQISLIGRFSKNITILYDGDTAGINASMRGVNLILEKGLDVKIVTFPNGEDPDSYVKKIGGEGFRAFLEKNQKDFILFKTALGLDEAKNDPLKRAGVIRDIVETIIKIPDSIKQSVFFKECSNLLEIDEEVLIEEGNSILLREQKKKYNQQRHDGGGKSMPPSVEELIPEEKKEESVDPVMAFQERECIRILLEYGKEKDEDDNRLSHFLISEIDQISFSTPVYRKILEVYKIEIGKGNFVDARFFIHHSDTEIKNEVVNLISEKGIISETWGKKFKIIVPEKDAKLHQVVYGNILRLKYRTIRKLCAESMDLLKNARGEEEVMENQKIYFELKQQENELAKELGITYS